MRPGKTELSREDRPVRVLLVEDDLKLARLTARYLEQHGLQVTCLPDGREVTRVAVASVPDVILLDLMLPDRDGLELCRELRAVCNVPIIMVTARGEEACRVLGLDTGADDYVAKPFSSRELLARVQAHVRRARGLMGPQRRVLRAGRVVVDEATILASVDDRPLTLTTFEFRLLRALVSRAGEVIGREELLELAGGNPEETFDRSIDGHISRLRQKLGDDPRNPSILRTIRGVGYLLVDRSA